MCGGCKNVNVGDGDHFERYSGSDHHEGYNEYSVIETTTVTHDDGSPSQAPPGYYQGQPGGYPPGQPPAFPPGQGPPPGAGYVQPGYPP